MKISSVVVWEISTWQTKQTSHLAHCSWLSQIQQKEEEKEPYFSYVHIHMVF
jgi:hypothetical protein